MEQDRADNAEVGRSEQNRVDKGREEEEQNRTRRDKQGEENQTHA